MKTFSFFLVCFVLWACGSPSKQNASTLPAEKKASHAPLPKTVRQDSIVPPPTQNRNNYFMDKARHESQINKVFPYDIALKTAEGKVLRSDEVLRKNDKPTILLFWLTTCPPCAREMQAISEKYADWQKEADFNLIAISTDFSKNYPNFVKRVKQKKWPWKSYHDTNREFRKVMPGGLNGLPQTFILDKAGNIVYHKRKYRPGDEDKLFEEIKKLN